MDDTSKCPFSGGGRGHGNHDWWPEQLNLSVLHQNSNLSDPMGAAFATYDALSHLMKADFVSADPVTIGAMMILLG